MKTAAIYNPYWDTLGGGEKYTATTIAAYIKAKYRPTIIWPSQNLLEKISSRFGLNLDGSQIDSDLWTAFHTASATAKLKLSRQFDSFLWVSDGSIPLLGSKRNLLHFQVPFSRKASLLNRIKLKNFDHILCNSKFTKSVIDKNYDCNSRVLYPPVTLIPSLKKENIILSVGRFDNILHSKRQDILIDAFKKINAPGWKLVLTGGSLDPTAQMESLNKFIGDSHIDLIVNPNFQEIKQLYGTAKIYWHAAGFGSNLKKNPEKAEHFGISTVEAMSAGAIPVVFAGGGQLEIVQNSQNGFLWQTPGELIDKTKAIINNQTDSLSLINNAITTADKFSQERFIDEFVQYLS